MHFRRTGALTFPDVGRDELVGPRFNAIAICGEPTMTAEYASHARHHARVRVLDQCAGGIRRAISGTFIPSAPFGRLNGGVAVAR